VKPSAIIIWLNYNSFEILNMVLGGILQPMILVRIMSLLGLALANRNRDSDVKLVYP